MITNTHTIRTLNISFAPGWFWGERYKEVSSDARSDRYRNANFAPPFFTCFIGFIFFPQQTLGFTGGFRPSTIFVRLLKKGVEPKNLPFIKESFFCIQTAVVIFVCVIFH